MSNPALTNNPAISGKTPSAEELQRIYDQPSATTYQQGAAQATVQGAYAAGAGPQQPPVSSGSDRPMTVENTISKTVMLFLVVLAFGAIGWFVPILMIPGAIAGLVLGLVNSFKKQPSVPLIICYAAAEGLFLGGISMTFESNWPGIVSQAIIGTLAVFGVTLLLFRSGKVRTSPRFTKMILIAMVGYLVFSVINMILVWTGASSNPWGLRGVEVFGIPLGLAIGLLAVFMAAYSLVMDFELIQNGVERRVPEKWGWQSAFGLTVTLVWLYVEILRILAILRGNN